MNHQNKKTVDSELNRSKMNTSLVGILEIETQSLKNQYIERRITWAEKYFGTCTERKKWNEEKWAEYLGVNTSIANAGTNMEFVTFYKGFHNSRESVRYQNLRTESLKIVAGGLEKFLLQEKQKALAHYQNSVLKLAERIAKKGLDISNITVQTSHIGVNINTVLTDGQKTVKAFTIIAEGEVQCPHYRYLIK